MALGKSFAPSDDGSVARRGGPSPAPIQEAIKVLSLQMPRVVGASAPNAASLMAGAPGAGGGGLGGPTSNPILEQLLRALFAGGAGGGGQMPGLPGAPPPPARPVPGFDWSTPPVPRVPAPPMMPSQAIQTPDGSPKAMLPQFNAMMPRL
jgi:hypothetical protein